MHVLQLGPYPPPEGGINRNLLAIRAELVKAGHRCSIMATSRSTRITPEPHVYHPRSPLKVLKLLRDIKSDVLHLHLGGDIGKRILALTFIASVLGRGKKVLSVHSGGYPLSREGKAARRNSIRGFVFRRFDEVIAVNPLIADVFVRYGLEPDHLHVIYPFVHRVPDANVTIPDELAAFRARSSPMLLTVGLLEPEYDLSMQIDAMETLLREFPEAGLMIVGSGSLESELRAAVNAKPFKDRILLAGDVEHKVTLHLLNDCDILLRTTLFDGDAISVREALFLNTPVIATDNGMRPDGVYLIPPHDPEALIDAIKLLGRSQKSKETPSTDDMSNVQKVLEVYES